MRSTGCQRPGAYTPGQGPGEGGEDKIMFWVFCTQSLLKIVQDFCSALNILPTQPHMNPTTALCDWDLKQPWPFFYLEDVVTQAEHGRVKEAERLGCQGDKQICDVRSHAYEPYQANQDVGATHGENLSVAKGDADGDVALNGHAGQVDGRVACGEDGEEDEETTEGHVDGVQDVAQQEEGDGDGQLDAIVDHHVDEQDITRVLIEHLREEEEREKREMRESETN